MTLVTIGLPVFNGGNYLEQALASIQAQTFQDFVVHISDNGSEDQTPEIAAAWAAKDSRFTHDRLAENCGAAENFNRVLRQCSTPYFRWHAHDDLMAPSLLQVCVDEMLRDASLVGCSTQAEYIGPKGESLKMPIRPLPLMQATPSRRMGHFLLRHSRCDSIFGLYRTEVLQRTVQIPPYRGGDQVTLCNLAILGPRLELPARLFMVRDHKSCSMQTMVSADEITKWYDPNSNLHIGSVRLHLFRMKLTMLKDQDLSISERLRCRLILVWWLTRQSIVWPIKRTIKTAIGLGSRGHQ